MCQENRNPTNHFRKIAIIVLLALGSLAITTACVYPEGYYDESGRGGGGRGRWHHGHDRHDGHDGHWDRGSGRG